MFSTYAVAPKPHAYIHVANLKPGPGNCFNIDAIWGLPGTLNSSSSGLCAALKRKDCLRHDVKGSRPYTDVQLRLPRNPVIQDFFRKTYDKENLIKGLQARHQQEFGQKDVHYEVIAADLDEGEVEAWFGDAIHIARSHEPVTWRMDIGETSLFDTQIQLRSGDYLTTIGQGHVTHAVDPWPFGHHQLFVVNEPDKELAFYTEPGGPKIEAFDQPGETGWYRLFDPANEASSLLIKTTPVAKPIEPSGPKEATLSLQLIALLIPELGATQAADTPWISFSRDGELVAADSAQYVAGLHARGAAAYWHHGNIECKLGPTGQLLPGRAHRVHWQPAPAGLPRCKGLLFLPKPVSMPLAATGETDFGRLRLDLDFIRHCADMAQHGTSRQHVRLAVENHALHVHLCEQVGPCHHLSADISTIVPIEDDALLQAGDCLAVGAFLFQVAPSDSHGPTGIPR